MSESLSSKYKVPANLRPLLEAFARETLRTQPPDLIDFGRTFFEALHQAQKSNPRADVIGEEKLYNQFRSTLQHKLTAREHTPDSVKLPTDTQPNSELPSHRSGTIPDSAKDLPPLDLHSQRLEPNTQRDTNHFQTPIVSQPNSKPPTSKMQPPQQPGSSGNSRPTSPEALAATKIQAVYRGHFVRNHPEKFGIDTIDVTRRLSNDRLFSADTKKDLKRHSVGGYSLETANTPDDRAAVKIQSEIRGFLARKRVDEMKKQNSEAAIKIQAHIRGFLTRKNLNKDGVSPSRLSLQSNDELVH